MQINPDIRLAGLPKGTIVPVQLRCPRMTCPSHGQRWSARAEVVNEYGVEIKTNKRCLCGVSGSLADIEVPA